LVALAALACAAGAPAASAAGPATVVQPFGLVVDHAGGRVYWSNLTGTISWASLDGSASGALNTGAGALTEPEGLAVDHDRGLLYWANFGTPTTTIGFAKLDDSGGGNLATPGAPALNPSGLALVGDTLYWTSGELHNLISFASVTGTGGGALTITGSGSVQAPRGIAFDPGGGRLYWTNRGDNTIASAELNGANSRNLATPGAIVSSPHSVAIDPGGRRIYWVNDSDASSAAPHSIWFANLDSPGAGQLHLPGDSSTDSVAVDPATGRIYWASESSGAQSPGAVRSANPDGSDVKVLFPPPVDNTLHAPVIDDAPPASTPLTDASFLYHAADKGVALSCALDGGATRTCTGRSSFAALAVGRHCFTVREQRNGTFGPPAQACWTVTQLAPGCTAGFHHGYFIAAGAATLARRQVVFHATSDGVAGRIALTTRTSAKGARVTYRLDGRTLSAGASATLAFAQLDRTRSHTLTVDVAAGGRRARITRRFRYVSFVAVACGGRQVVGRIVPRTVRLGGAHVTVSAQVPPEIRGTAKLRFVVTSSRPGVLRAVRFVFGGKLLDQHARNAALTAQQLSADGEQVMTVALVPAHGRTVTLRITFRTRST
jgi:DNA-binding beta-propeller fold protein YncE